MLETKVNNNNSWQFSGADYMVVIVPRTFWEFPVNPYNSLWANYLHVTGGPTEAQTKHFSKGQEPALGSAARLSGCWGRVLKLLTAGSCDAIKSTNAFHGWAHGDSDVWPEVGRAGEVEVGTIGMENPFFLFPIHQFFPLSFTDLTLNSEVFKSYLLVPLWDFDFLLLFVTCPFSWSVVQFCDRMEKPSFPVFAAASSPQAAPSCHTDTLSKYDSYRHGCMHKERGSDLREAALGHLEARRNMTPSEIEFKTKSNKNKDTRFGNGCQVWC